MAIPKCRINHDKFEAIVPLLHGDYWAAVQVMTLRDAHGSITPEILGTVVAVTPALLERFDFEPAQHIPPPGGATQPDSNPQPAVSSPPVPRADSPVETRYEPSLVVQTGYYPYACYQPPAYPQPYAAYSPAGSPPATQSRAMPGPATGYGPPAASQPPPPQGQLYAGGPHAPHGQSPGSRPSGPPHHSYVHAAPTPRGTDSHSGSAALTSTHPDPPFSQSSSASPSPAAAPWCQASPQGSNVMGRGIHDNGPPANAPAQSTRQWAPKPPEPPQLEAVQVELASARQTKDETLQEWADRIMGLTSRAFPDFLDHQLQSKAVLYFCWGCRDQEAGAATLNLRPKTLEEATKCLTWRKHSFRVVGSRTLKDVSKARIGSNAPLQEEEVRKADASGGPSLQQPHSGQAAPSPQSLQASLAEINKRIGGLESKPSLQASLAEINKRIDGLESKPSLQGSLAEIDKRVDGLETKHCTVAGAVERLTKEVNRRVDGLETKHCAVAGAVERLTKEVNKRVDGLETKLCAVAGAVGQLTKDVSKLCSQRQTLTPTRPCFRCGRPGHFRKDCAAAIPAKSESQVQEEGEELNFSGPEEEATPWPDNGRPLARGPGDHSPGELAKPTEAPVGGGRRDPLPPLMPVTPVTVAPPSNPPTCFAPSEAGTLAMGYEEFVAIVTQALILLSNPSSSSGGPPFSPLLGVRQPPSPGPRTSTPDRPVPEGGQSLSTGASAPSVKSLQALPPAFTPRPLAAGAPPPAQPTGVASSPSALPLDKGTPPPPVLQAADPDTSTELSHSVTLPLPDISFMGEGPLIGDVPACPLLMDSGLAAAHAADPQTLPAPARPERLIDNDLTTAHTAGDLQALPAPPQLLDNGPATARTAAEPQASPALAQLEQPPPLRKEEEEGEDSDATVAYPPPQIGVVEQEEKTVGEVSVCQWQSCPMLDVPILMALSPAPNPRPLAAGTPPSTWLTRRANSSLNPPLNKGTPPPPVPQAVHSETCMELIRATTLPLPELPAMGQDPPPSDVQASSPPVDDDPAAVFTADESPTSPAHVQPETVLPEGLHLRAVVPPNTLKRVTGILDQRMNASVHEPP